MLDPNPTTIATHHPIATPAQLDLAALKAKQRSTWSAGDYAVIGTTLQIVGETLCDAAEIAAGERVLDVACGNGNAALAAARRYAEVTGIDYVPALLERARSRAAADGLTLELREGDAESLPFGDATFDAVLSTFGVMFTPDQSRAAAEILRVCRSGGRIALASWTPDGFIGKVFKLVGKYVPPPAGVRKPAEWGTEERLRELFGEEIRDVRARRRDYLFRYRSASHWVEVFRRWYGPIHKAFAALPAERAGELERELTALLEESNIGGARTLAVPSTYLEVVLIRA